MNRQILLQNICKKINAKTYLEIGVRDGVILRAINAPNKIGVDPSVVFPLELKWKKFIGKVKFLMVHKTSDDFFKDDAQKMLENGIDVAFVDGLHTYRQAFIDVENCLQYLNDGGYIVMHDCNPISEAGAYPVKESMEELSMAIAEGKIPQDWDRNWNGDVWKAFVHLRVKHPELEMYTIDADWGLGIIRKGTGVQIDGLNETEIPKLNYKDLDRNREEWLNLKSPVFVSELLEN